MITPRDIEIFESLNRYRWLRSNFIHAIVGGSKQNVCRRLGILNREGYLHKPEQQKQSYNARYSPRVYELTAKSKALISDPKHWVATHHFSHQLMVSEIIVSFQIAARQKNISFRSGDELLKAKPLALPCEIVWEGRTAPKKAIEPDALFALGDYFFVVEADTGTETLESGVLQRNAYLHKLIGYIHVLYNKTYKTEWGVSNLFVLNITTKPQRSKNMQALFSEIRRFQGETNPRSRSLSFKAYPNLGSHEETAHPLLHVLDDPMERVGNPPLIIGDLVGRQTTAHS